MTTTSEVAQRNRSGLEAACQAVAGQAAVSGWTGEELQRIGGAQELRLASRRRDASLGPFTTMWVVRAGK